jgi:hypothetical protein
MKEGYCPELVIENYVEEGLVGFINSKWKIGSFR